MSFTDSDCVAIGRSDFETMLAFAQLMHRLMSQGEYVRALTPRLPPAARYAPPDESILMGYDFHITPGGPKLIEINNNAGGLYLPTGRWLPQPPLPELRGEMCRRLTDMFDSSWQYIAVMDERVQEQFMYPEMLAYAALLQRDGRRAQVVNPEDIHADDSGALWLAGGRLDAIYNRHTDFYLESRALAHVRRAYLGGRVALSPNPHSYGLLGDKGRMVDWWHKGLLERCLDAAELVLVRNVVPETHAMAAMPREQLWRERKQWVFKPTARHGGKGVMPGKAMGRARFDGMDPVATVVQRFVPPGKVALKDGDYHFDARLYMHGGELIAVAARVWQGLVLNFREPGSGFLPLCIV